MSPAARPPDDPLRRVLRAGDPAAAEPGLSDVERSRMRAIVASAGRGGRRESRLAGRLLLAAAMAAVAASAALGLRLGLRGSHPGDAAAVTAPAARSDVVAALDSRPRTRVLHFQTKGGTRVVWTLDRDFNL